jgi:hypothetical protein
MVARSNSTTERLLLRQAKATWITVNGPALGVYLKSSHRIRHTSQPECPNHPRAYNLQRAFGRRFGVDAPIGKKSGLLSLVETAQQFTAY